MRLFTFVQILFSYFDDPQKCRKNCVCVCARVCARACACFFWHNTITGCKYAWVLFFIKKNASCKNSYRSNVQDVTVKIVATRPRVAPVMRRLRHTAPLTSSATGYSMHSCSCKKDNQLISIKMNFFSDIQSNQGTFMSRAFRQNCDPKKSK